MKEQVLHHERNLRALFDEAEHKYYIDGELYPGVTSLVGNFFDAFDKDAVAKKVGYIKGVNPESLKQDWDDSTTYGKMVHKAIEDLVNLGVESPDTTFITDTFLYTMEQYKIEPIVCELTVFDETIRRASNIDIIGIKDNEIVIVDTKTMKKPIERSAYKGKRCFYPIAHLEQSKFNKHALQVNIYRHWLKTRYGLPVSDVNYVFSFNENAEVVSQMIEIPPMDMEMELIYTYLKTITPQ